MQLSRFTDYSLRVLFYAAVNNQRLTNLSEIADFYSISMEHLRKVVHQLAKSGYLETFRGKKGGLRLLMPPEQVNIGVLVRETEGNSPLIDCAGQACLLTGQCSLHNVLAQALEAFYQSLGQYTLADLLADPAMRDKLIAHVQA